MNAFYNENDPGKAEWLRNLMNADVIASGVVDERDIRDIAPAELAGYTQCHFFAGIGIWSYALRQAGWPDNRPVWTGSCPCPPFSSAGRTFRCPVCNTPRPVPHALRTGAFACIGCDHTWHADDRHLWPELFRLYRHHSDVPFIGEQVASGDGRAWFDLVRASLEMLGNAVAVVDACSAGFGAPHIRQRLYFGAQRVADTERGSAERHRHEVAGETSSDQGGEEERQRVRAHAGHGRNAHRRGPTNGFWGRADWLGCRDGKWRPVEPGTSPLAHGASSRVLRLRAYGDGIVAPQAIEFIKAFDEVTHDPTHP